MTSVRPITFLEGVTPRALHRMSQAPARASFPPKGLGDFGGPNTEASPYPSVQVFRNSAPSSERLTGKPLLSGLSWLSYSSSGLSPNRRVWSATRSRLSPDRELPTPARLNDPLGFGPPGRDLHPLCIIAASPANRRGRFVAVAPAPAAHGRGPQAHTHRIECRDYFGGRRFCHTRAACVCVARITPTSLRRARTSPSPGIRLYGSAPN